MSMILSEESNSLKVLIPNSEAIKTSQFKQTNDREVTGYYTNDKAVIKEKIVNFLKEDYDYVIDTKACLEIIDILLEYKENYGYLYRDDMQSLSASYTYFKKFDNSYITIPKMFYSGQNERYLKFVNDDERVYNLRIILYAEITGFSITKNDLQKQYIIAPFVQENIKKVLNRAKKKYTKDELREFYINNLKNNELVKKQIDLQEQFINEYPINKLESLTKEDYCLGVGNKESFCYKLEYGIYKNTALSIGGARASKYGLYYSSSDNKYHDNNNKVIENNKVDAYFLELKKQLIDFICKAKDVNNKLNILDVERKYPLLGVQGNYMVLTKLLSLYYPDMFISTSKEDVYQKLAAYFNLQYFNNPLKNSYYFNVVFRNFVPEANNNHGYYIADCLWKFFMKNKFEDKEVMVTESEESMLELFKKWLLENGLTVSTTTGYVNSIKLTSKEANQDGILTKDIYTIKDLQELDNLIDALSLNDKFLQRKERSHHQNSAALDRYREFLTTINNKEEITSYDENDFFKEVFITNEKYYSMVSLLKKKKNLIIEGAPGVGKTFMAKRLAYSMLKAKDKERVELIQFHQSYAYEDFIEGYRPSEIGFELQRGLFYKLCKKAYNDHDRDYFLIIDEINRGNLSKIFGELLMLVEGDKREESLKLAYSEEEFSVPDNLYIIGLMNTADRSLAIMDYALRRRFSFVPIEPAFNNVVFLETFKNLFDKDYTSLIKIIEDINLDIKSDPSLGEGFEIGHSYFLPNLKGRKGNISDIEEIINYDILPLLKEYWYDDKDKYNNWQNILNNQLKVLNDKR